MRTLSLRIVNTHQQFLSSVEFLLDFLAQLSFGQFEVLTHITRLGHQRQEAIFLHIDQLQKRRVKYPMKRRRRVQFISRSKLTTKSSRLTLGTSILWVDGHKSSYFLWVKMSRPTKCTYEQRAV